MSVDITKDLVAHVAKLGMLKIDDKEMGAYQAHLTKVLISIEELEAVNTDGVLPFANPMRECLELFKDHIDRRDDVIAPSLPVQDVLKNAPDQKLNQFKIEAVIGDGE
jgi:aspartyl-tRNA(Asn)/glutamyl-tRNA(Gln) amidotransferase subunit C